MLLGRSFIWELICFAKKKKKSLKTSACALSRFQAEDAGYTWAWGRSFTCAGVCVRPRSVSTPSHAPSLLPLGPSSPRLHPPCQILAFPAQILPLLRSLPRHLEICPSEPRGTLFSSWAFPIFDPHEDPTRRKGSRNIHRMKLLICVCAPPLKGRRLLLR